MKTHSLFLALLLSALSACAQSPVAATSPAEPADRQPVSQGLTAEVLYQFLLGEIAGQRGDMRLAADAYADLANRTRDTRVARRATEVALYARQPALALKNARLWQSLDPSSPKALQTLASLLIGEGRLSEAKPHLDAWVRSGKPADSFMQLHGLLARQSDKQAVLTLISDLAASYPDLAEARFALSQAALQAGQDQKALTGLEQALQIKPSWEAAALFKAQVLRQSVGDAEALAFIKAYLAANPAAREMRLAYAKQLARMGDMAQSRQQFVQLSQETPDDPEPHFALGLIAMQADDLDSAQASFTKALELEHPDEGAVRLYLGQLAEARNRLEEALTWYQSVDKGRQRFDAQLRAATTLGRLGRVPDARAWLAKVVPRGEAERIQVVQTEAQLLRDAKDVQGAFQVLTQALEKYPDAMELLYDRAMVAEKIDRLDVVETDLRRLIQIKPDYAHAYNALGYTLADRTPRLAEAIDLLKQALKLSPEDPFILDSMGWAQLKAKHYPEALDYLRRAYAAKADPEIAAHLGEALWVSGAHEEAQRIWKNSLTANPDNESLRDTVSRLTR